MNAEKQLIANELLPVYQTTDTGERVVDARELYGFLNVATRFNDWIVRQIGKYGFIEGDDFYSFLSKTSEIGGRPATEYILKLDMAKELAMVENNEMGRKARKYFIEVEKRYHARVPLSSPNTEFDQITKLLQMLRMGEREGLFNGASNRAIRLQIAEMVLRQPLQLDVLTGSNPIDNERPQWVKEGYGAKTIGMMLGVSATKVGITAKKHALQSDEYGGWYEYTSKGRKHSIFIYNEEGKEALLDLLDDSRLASS